MNTNLKLYAAVTGNHVPMAAYDALGTGAWNARALVAASHKGLAHRAAAAAGVKVNLNGWRIASPRRLSILANNPDIDLVITSLLRNPAPGTVLLSRPYAAGFVARWHHGLQRWVRVAEFTGNTLELLPGAVDAVHPDSLGNLWRVDADAWRARTISGEILGNWRSLDDVLAQHTLRARAL